VTQGAAAQHVRGLEDRLGVLLFERRGRTLVLTDPGSRYATANVRPEPLRVQVSVTPTFATKWLLPRLPEFTAAHPELDLGIVASERRATFHADDVDLAVRFGPAPNEPNVTTRRSAARASRSPAATSSRATSPRADWSIPSRRRSSATRPSTWSRRAARGDPSRPRP
jgi:DNA-binding transcriptional LysR family regulator